ncbi:uncharacterized protein G2W53_039415 [Senna tora]|uniref:Uncharacterized protein n=1 Tax=Senna tora TaxID=362788 RepID=A0A834T1A6_9FABA|nr:uncharacterized protein G2W53_039415 [Senna tora]
MVLEKMQTGIGGLNTKVDEIHTEVREIQDGLRALLQNFSLTPECDDPQASLCRPTQFKRESTHEGCAKRLEELATSHQKEKLALEVEVTKLKEDKKTHEQQILDLRAKLELGNPTLRIGQIDYLKEPFEAEDTTRGKAEEEARIRAEGANSWVEIAEGTRENVENSGITALPSLKGVPKDTEVDNTDVAKSTVMAKPTS